MNITFVTDNYNSILGILLYWVPLSLCVFGYTIRTARNYMEDTTNRAAVVKAGSGYYHPTDTLGTLIGRGIASIFPVVNIWCALFDIAPLLFQKMFRWFGRVFNQPLVPAPKKQEK